MTKNWLESEYKPPCINWGKVPANTPLYVWDSPGEGEKPRKLVKHFSRYEPKEDKVYCWMNGGTSFTYSRDCPWDNAEFLLKEDKAKYMEML